MKETFEAWDNFLTEQKYLENRSILMKAIFKARQPDEIVIRPRKTIYVRHPITRKKIPMFRKGQYYEGHFSGGHMVRIEVERQDGLGSCYQSSMTYDYEWHDSKQKNFSGWDQDTEKEVTFVKQPWSKCDRNVRGVESIAMEKDKLVAIIEANAGGATEKQIRRILGNDSRVTVKGGAGHLVPIIGKRRPKAPRWLKRAYGSHRISVTIKDSPLFEVLNFLVQYSREVRKKGVAVYVSRDINPKKTVSIDILDDYPGTILYKIIKQSNIKFKIKKRTFYLGAVGPWLPLAEAMVKWYGMPAPQIADRGGSPEEEARRKKEDAKNRDAANKRFQKAQKGDRPEEEKESQYDNIIKIAAHEYRVDPNLIKAIIKIESNFNPQKVDPTGGKKGLMQLDPGLIEFLRTVPGLGFEFTNPMDPEQNIKAGAKYLQMLQKAFKNINLAIASWRAGPSVIKAAAPSKEVGKWVNRVLRARSAYKLGAKVQ